MTIIDKKQASLTALLFTLIFHLTDLHLLFYHFIIKIGNLAFIHKKTRKFYFNTLEIRKLPAYCMFFFIYLFLSGKLYK